MSAPAQLYFSTPLAEIRDRDEFISCPLSECRSVGFGDDHICFTDKPLGGMGKYVFSLNFDEQMEEALRQYRYKNEFRGDSKMRSYAIPHSFLKLHGDLTKGTYDALTDRAWNKWVVPVLDRRPTKDSKYLGKWSVVWASRKGIAEASVTGRYPAIGEIEYLEVEIRVNSRFDPQFDYVILEDHEEAYPKSETSTQLWRTFNLTTLAGITPKWAIFTRTWREWSRNKAVIDSAVNYICAFIPEVRPAIEFALATTLKHNVGRAWRMVADEINESLSEQERTAADIGRLGGHSWTAVESMPQRIAERLSRFLPDPWVPPRPKPEFENAETTPRAAIANLYGAPATRGPGIEYSTQDRERYVGFLGELAEKPRPRSNPTPRFNHGSR